MDLTVCAKCAHHIFIKDKVCPHCGHVRQNTISYTGKRATLTLLMGLATLTACGEDEKDTADAEPAVEPAGEPEYGVVDTSVPEPDMQEDYGVPDIDMDEDGYFDYEDCNDNDPNTFPGSAENDSTTDCMTDADGDGYGDSGAQSPVIPGTDCNDADGSVYPGATETPGDGIDSDCNGTDE